MTTDRLLPEAAQGRYRIDPDRTRVDTDVKTMFGLMTVHGHFRARNGTIEIGPDETSSWARVAIDASSFSSKNRRRDRDVVAASVLDAEHHPDISFESSSIEKSAEGWTAHGQLTVRGVRQPVDLAVRMEGTMDRSVVFHIEGVVDREAFGIKGSTNMMGRVATVHVDALATPE